MASASTKELRLKGSSFLRRHASRHGIANASRKLTAQVIRELSQHYYTAHKVVVADDDLQVTYPSKCPCYLDHIVKLIPTPNIEYLEYTHMFLICRSKIHRAQTEVRMEMLKKEKAYK